MTIANEVARISLTGVHVPKASDLLAKQIKENIILGNIPDGAQLPTEKELVEQIGLSRPTVREALRILETEGLIAIKTGRGGGAVVRHPSSESVTRPLALLLQFQKSRLSDLLEARRLVEPLIARLAAAHRTEEDLARIENSLKLMGADLTDTRAFLDANVSFHIQVAAASGNAVLNTLMSSLRDLIYQFSSEITIDIPTRRLTLLEHTATYEGIKAGDPDLAANAMLEHHVSFDNYMAEHYGDLSSIMMTVNPRQFQPLNRR
ncbi:MAG: FadR family transcriptional regulator [Chloroflexi bacterium]|nr:FadR family transcriptional regulator [Chloroflexota bacterium]MDA8187840.1 FadR/GntR family transcriptional regulator [Dehalococcoidales bacterium]